MESHTIVVAESKVKTRKLTLNLPYLAYEIKCPYKYNTDLIYN